MQLNDRGQQIATAIRGRDRAVVRQLVASVHVLTDRVHIAISTAALSELLQVAMEEDATETFSLTSNIRVTRTGRAVRLVHTSGVKVGMVAAGAVSPLRTALSTMQSGL
jgi:site-specific DNA recombinase